MSKETLNQKLAAIGEQHLSKTLLTGFCCSVVLHGSVASAIGQFWQPADKIVEVTLVDPVEEPPEVKPTPMPPPTVRPVVRPSLPIKVTLVKSPPPTPTVQPIPQPTPPVPQNKQRPIDIAQQPVPTPTPSAPPPPLEPEKPEPLPTIVTKVLTRKPIEQAMKQQNAEPVSDRQSGAKRNQGQLTTSNSRVSQMAFNPISPQKPQTHEKKSPNSGKPDSSKKPPGSKPEDSRNRIARMDNNNGVPSRNSTQLALSSTSTGATAMAAALAGAEGNPGVASAPAAEGSNASPGNIASIASAASEGTVGGNNNQGVISGGTGQRSAGIASAIAGDGLGPASESGDNPFSGGTPGTSTSIATAGTGNNTNSSNQSGLTSGVKRSRTIATATATAGGDSFGGADDLAGSGLGSPGRVGSIASKAGSGTPGNNQGGLGSRSTSVAGLASALQGSEKGSLGGFGNLESSSPGNLRRVASSGNDLGAPNGRNSAPLASGGRRSALPGGEIGFGAEVGSDDGPSNLGQTRRQVKKEAPRCINNCTVNGLTLEEADLGRDRVRVKIRVDQNGIVLSAAIFKSSGNPRLDNLILSATQKMEFLPTGKTESYTIRHNLRAS